jgi:hypothetical protein
LTKGELIMPQRKGCIPWNKGKKGYMIPWNKGKKLPKLSGKNSSSWNGGKFTRKDGYVEIYSPQHPRVLTRKAKMIRQYVMEHILLAESKLGRFLHDNEVVHHLNGIRNDNRIENIVVMTRAKHAKEHNPRVPKNKWAHSYASCLGCGTIEKKHWGKGYCRNCFMRRFRKSRSKNISAGVAVNIQEVRE